MENFAPDFDLESWYRLSQLLSVMIKLASESALLCSLADRDGVLLPGEHV